MNEVYSSGQFVNIPSLILTGKRSMQCPCCGKEWYKEGSGYGFVKRSATTHVYSCFVKLLAEQGLKMKDVYDMDKLAWQLESV